MKYLIFVCVFILGFSGLQAQSSEDTSGKNGAPSSTLSPEVVEGLQNTKKATDGVNNETDSTGNDETDSTGEALGCIGGGLSGSLEGAHTGAEISKTLGLRGKAAKVVIGIGSGIGAVSGCIDGMKNQSNSSNFIYEGEAAPEGRRPNPLRNL